jgi:hypothetical protein
LILAKKTWPIICVNPIVALTIPIWVWYKFWSQCMKYYNCFSRIYMFPTWMWLMDSATKALEPFFVASTKFWWVTKCFIRTPILSTCQPCLAPANPVESSNATKHSSSTQTLLFVFGGLKSSWLHSRHPLDLWQGWCCCLFYCCIISSYLFYYWLVSSYLPSPFMIGVPKRSV